MDFGEHIQAIAEKVEKPQGMWGREGSPGTDGSLHGGRRMLAFITVRNKFRETASIWCVVIPSKSLVRPLQAFTSPRFLFYVFKICNMTFSYTYWNDCYHCQTKLRWLGSVLTLWGNLIWLSPNSIWDQNHEPRYHCSYLNVVRTSEVYSLGKFPVCDNTVALLTSRHTSRLTQLHRSNFSTLTNISPLPSSSTHISLP